MASLMQDGEGIPSTVRKAISRMVLDLRAALEDDFRKQLIALGVREDGIQPLPAGRTLTGPDQRVREVAVAVMDREVKGGSNKAQALQTFIRDSAYTFLNRAVGFRCLEEHGLLRVQGQPETVMKVDPARNASSLYWRVRNELPSSTNPREVWRETLRRAGEAISEQVKVLFDPSSEYAALLPLQPTIQRVIEALNSPEISPDAYTQDEFLGWVYQYYNTQDKNAVYAKLGKGGKIERPDELAAATCLYTERYMVDYLLQNTLGALWMEMHPDSKLYENWPYFVRPPEGNPRPYRAPRPMREITLMDPACGSGHFLVRAFGLLVEMYREEGRETEAEIPHLILEHNLHGIDIDLRAVQIAALALYIKGCMLTGAGFRPRRLNLIPADAVLPGDTPPPEYMARFRGDSELESLVKGIWQGLKNVREFGSLLHPEKAVGELSRRRQKAHQMRLGQEAPDAVQWELWERDLLADLRREFDRQNKSNDLGQQLFGKEAAKGVSLVEALGQRYDVVVANPPYAGSKNLSPRLKQFLEREYKDGKRDLYAAFIIRCRDFCRPGGCTGMVTQQSWMFLRSFSALRKDLLEHPAITTLAHLGPRAFEEISGEVVNIALFTLRTEAPTKEHRISAFRLVGPKSPTEKDMLLRQAISGQAPAVVSSPHQSDFLPIPETPVVYWLSDHLLSLLSQGRRVGEMARVVAGLSTGDNDHFMRAFWECPTDADRWVPYEKGGAYRKWEGLRNWSVDWRNGGSSIRLYHGSAIRSEQLYFKDGLTYTGLARGSIGMRLLHGDSIFAANSSSGVFPVEECDPLELAAVLNCRVVSYLLRSILPKMQISEEYFSRLPLPIRSAQGLSQLANRAILLKRTLISSDMLERSFVRSVAERSHGRQAASLFPSVCSIDVVTACLHTVEGLIERMVFDCYEIGDSDEKRITDETGVPSGWYPLISRYDGPLEAPSAQEVANDLEYHPKAHSCLALSSVEFAHLKDKIRKLYQAGPGATTEYESDGRDEEEEEAVLGAHIPIPTETFLEELSQRLEVHPISVFWLLKEMREQEGLVSPPELKRNLEDYASVTILRLLGYRWPEQDKYEEGHGPVIDPSLVDDDGIIPVVSSADEATAAERVRMRLERDFDEEGAIQSEKEFRQWVGKDIDEWLRREFFERHVQQFKQRPIAWHLVSPERTFEVFVLYHKLSRATLQKLRTQYAGNFIERLRVEQERARQRKEDARVRELQLQIEDVEEFRSRVEAIERGDELKYRIRCRWKGEEETGRPGPYAPDIDDGVKVNIRPFQEAGLLAVKEVIKKW